MPRQQFNLAARLEKQATNVENDGHLNAARYMRDAAAALRAAATPSAQGASLLPDASPGNGAEKVREALANLLVEDDSDEADDECELCGGRGTVDAYTDRTSNDQRFEGRDEIGCPCCIERSHSRQIRAALHSTSAAGETTSSDGPEPASTIPAGACEPASAAIRHSGPSEAIPAVLAMRECPFCKSRCVTATVNAHGWKVVECDDCGASGPCIDLDGDQYIERWNARAAIDNPSPEAKAFIEQQAKALSEADSRYNTAVGSRIEWRHAAETQEARALAAEGRLAEAMKVIEPFANLAVNCDDANIEDHHETDGYLTAGILRAARSFLNSASNKEPK